MVPFRNRLLGILIFFCTFSLWIETAAAGDVGDLTSLADATNIEMEDSVKRLRGETIMGRGRIMNVSRLSMPGEFEVQVYCVREKVWAIVLTSNRYVENLKYRDEVRFSGKLKDIKKWVIKSGIEIRVLLNDGDISR